jgi:hypothetical protein
MEEQLIGQMNIDFMGEKSFLKNQNNDLPEQVGLHSP